MRYRRIKRSASCKRVVMWLTDAFCFQKLTNWIRNNARKMAGASKVTQTRVTTSALGLLKPRKRQHLHQVEEVYHRLYKDKLEPLAKAALKEQLPELEDNPIGSEDEDGSDDNGDDNNLPKGQQSTDTSSVTKLRALRMKIRRQVRADAWVNETEDVHREVSEAMKHEREEVAELKGEEGKVGLERSPESREL